MFEQTFKNSDHIDELQFHPKDEKHEILGHLWKVKKEQINVWAEAGGVGNKEK